MIFYSFKLDETNKELCTIIIPLDKYQYNQLPMGVKVCPDIAQSLIMKMLDGLDIKGYINDLGIWTKTLSDKHLSLVDLVL